MLSQLQESGNSLCALEQNVVAMSSLAIAPGITDRYFRKGCIYGLYLSAHFERCCFSHVQNHHLLGTMRSDEINLYPNETPTCKVSGKPMDRNGLCGKAGVKNP